jgi:hypothetical protein
MRFDITKARKGRQDRPFRGLIYGPPGVGKSSFAGDAPSAVFFDANGDTDELDVERLPLPEDGSQYTWTDLLDAIDALATQEHPWRSLVIDDLGFVERLSWDALIARRPTSGKKQVRDIEDYGYGKGYQLVLDDWRKLLVRLEKLQRDKGLNVLFCAHDRVHKYKNPEGEDYGHHGPDVHINVVGLLNKWLDFMFFARPEVLVDERERKTVAIGTERRLIHTVGSAGFLAKNRYNLPPTLGLDWHAFEAAKREGMRAAEESLREIEAVISSADVELAAQIKNHLKRANGDANKLARLVEWARKKQSEDTEQ